VKNRASTRTVFRPISIWKSKASASSPSDPRVPNSGWNRCNPLCHWVDCLRETRYSMICQCQSRRGISIPPCKTQYHTPRHCSNAWRTVLQIAMRCRRFESEGTRCL